MRTMLQMVLYLGFISNLDTTVMEKPKNYSKENMLQIANDIKNNIVEI